MDDATGYQVGRGPGAYQSDKGRKKYKEKRRGLLDGVWWCLMEMVGMTEMTL